MNRVQLLGSLLLLVFIGSYFFKPLAFLFFGVLIFFFFKDRKETPDFSDLLTGLNQPSPLKQEELNTSLYRHNKQQYLKSNEWKTKRQQVLSRDLFQCQDCGTSSNLNVHHLRYDRLGTEPLSHLVTLCSSCHTNRHEKLGYPQTEQEYMDFNDPSQQYYSTNY